MTSPSLKHSMERPKQQQSGQKQGSIGQAVQRIGGVGTLCQLQNVGQHLCAENSSNVFWEGADFAGDSKRRNGTGLSFGSLLLLILNVPFAYARAEPFLLVGRNKSSLPPRHLGLRSGVAVWGSVGRMWELHARGETERAGGDTWGKRRVQPSGRSDVRQRHMIFVGGP